MTAATLAQLLSRILLVCGAIVFLVGDRALREFWSVNVVAAELIGIGGGLLIMILGGILDPATRKLGSRLARHPRS